MGYTELYSSPPAYTQCYKVIFSLMDIWREMEVLAGITLAEHFFVLACSDK